MNKESLNKNMVVVAINLGLLIGYTIYIRVTSTNGESVIELAVIIAMHFILCLFLALIPKYSKGFLLSALAVVLVGFSTCWLAYSIH